MSYIDFGTGASGEEDGMRTSMRARRPGVLGGFADVGDLRSIRRAHARLAWMACVLALAGCAQQPTKSTAKPAVNLSGYSPAFKEGFAAGCDTAKGHPRGDERRFNDEVQYARGWEDGRSICARR